ncbi:hypothetical protein QBC42DRAFT_301241, partial [Cladorrhinum samala]
MPSGGDSNGDGARRAPTAAMAPPPATATTGSTWPLPPSQPPATTQSRQNSVQKTPVRQQKPVPAQGAPQGSAAPRRRPSTGQRSRGLPPQQQRAGPGPQATAPPINRGQAESNFSLPQPPPQRMERRPSASKLDQAQTRREPSVQPQSAQPPRPAPSGPIPAAPGRSGSVQSVQQPSRSGPTVQGARPGTAQQQFNFTERSGPAPSVPPPNPNPGSLSQRTKTPDGNTAAASQVPAIKPLRTGAPHPQTQHQSVLPDELVPVALDLGTSADLSRSRDMSPPPRRKPVNQAPSNLPV